MDDQMSDNAEDKPFARDRERGEDQDVALAQSHSFEEAQADNPAQRFASARTEGGSDQFTAAEAGDDSEEGDDTGEDRQPTSGSTPNPL